MENKDTTIFDKIMQEEYNGWGASLPSHKWCSNTQSEVGFIINALDLKKHHTVLDLFCSWGRHVIELRKKGYNAKGLDKSKELIDKAKEIAKSENLEVHFLIADILTYNGKQLYDAISSIHASPFETWRTEVEIMEYLRKIQSLLKKGGKYLFGWNSNWNRADGAEKRWKRVLSEKGIRLFKRELPFYYYGYDEHRRILEKCKFSILNVFNDDSVNKTYNSSEPGLVFVVKK